jgi:hypothetical protein
VTAGERHRHGRRHSVGLMIEARHLAEDGGWSAPEIAQLFAKRGVTVSERQVYRWIDPKLAERDREASKAYWRSKIPERGTKLGQPHHTPEFKLARARELQRDRKLSCAAIAGVMSHDYPDQPVSEEQVWRALNVTGRWPSRSARQTLKEAA